MEREISYASKKYIWKPGWRFWTASICFTIGLGFVFWISNASAQEYSTDTIAIINAVKDSDSNLQMTLAWFAGGIMFTFWGFTGWKIAQKI